MQLITLQVVSRRPYPNCGVSYWHDPSATNIMAAALVTAAFCTRQAVAVLSCAIVHHCSSCIVRTAFSRHMIRTASAMQAGGRDNPAGPRVAPRTHGRRWLCMQQIPIIVMAPG